MVLDWLDMLFTRSTIKFPKLRIFLNFLTNQIASDENNNNKKKTIWILNFGSYDSELVVGFGEQDILEESFVLTK